MRTTSLAAAITCALVVAGISWTAQAAATGDARDAAQGMAERGTLAADVRGGNGNGNGNSNGNGNGNGRNGAGATRTPPGHGGTPPGQSGRESDEDASGRSHSLPHRGGLGLRGGRTDLCGDDDPLFGPLGQSGRSHVAHLEFVEIDPVAPPEEPDPEAPPTAIEGDPVDGGAWARMTYFWIGSEFAYVLNAHQVPAGSSHTLVHQAEDGSAICLGEGTANGGGQLHILDRVDPESHLPPELDPFVEATNDDPGLLHLVPSDAVDCETGELDAALESALESTGPVRFVDTDVLECPAD